MQAARAGCSCRRTVFGPWIPSATTQRTSSIQYKQTDLTTMSTDAEVHTEFLEPTSSRTEVDKLVRPHEQPLLDPQAYASRRYTRPSGTREHMHPEDTHEQAEPYASRRIRTARAQSTKERARPMPYASTWDTHAHRYPHAICIPTRIHTRMGTPMPYASQPGYTHARAHTHPTGYARCLHTTRHTSPVSDLQSRTAPGYMHRHGYTSPRTPGICVHLDTRPESHTHPAPGYAQRRHPSGIPAWSPGHKAWLPPTLHTGGHIVKGGQHPYPRGTRAPTTVRNIHIPWTRTLAKPMRILPNTPGARICSRFERGCRQLYTFPRYRVS